MRLILQPGERAYLGYGEWAVHPDEAEAILELGVVLVDGVRRRAQQVDTVNGYPLLRVEEDPAGFERWKVVIESNSSNEKVEEES